MGTAGRSAPLRRTGSLLVLLGLELAAVVGLHWLGRFEGLRIGWTEPVPWLLSSPVQDVLGALLRTVGLVMAYWLLVSTLLYLLASLTRLPAAVRAVGWATLPLVRRVADHAVAVTLATSMVGGGTLGVASPALAADRGRAGPPARKPVAAAQAAFAAQDDTTTTTVYRPKVAGAPKDADQADKDESSSRDSSTSSSESTTPSSQATSSSESTSTTEETTTTTGKPTTTTAAPTTTATTRATTTTERETTTTHRPTTTTAGSKTPPPAYVPAPASQAPAKEPTTTTTTTPTTTTAPPSTPSTTGLRPPAYRFPVAGTSPASKEGPPSSKSGGAAAGGSGSTGSQQEPGEETRPTPPYEVKPGESLWTIARDHLAGARSGGSGEPTNREVARYWLRVVAANKHHLWSGDPNLIFPKEPIILPRPPVD